MPQSKLTPGQPQHKYHRLDVARHGLSAFFTQGIELQERLLLINRPWEEGLLHRSADGQLHGHTAPHGGQHSTTDSGWCSGRS